ncbi:MAG: pantoate--beta-alanine ligase [Candidatus Dormibacteria bacterium]
MSTRITRLEAPPELRLWSDRCRAAGMEVGLVPTMGALHEGHRSLIRRARAECDRVVVSIFVNPLQFGPGEDVERYPRTAQGDLAMLDEEGVDAAFVPGAAAMYPSEASTTVHVDAALTSILEGAHRPRHFDGVATVVAKLLVAARPRRAYFGIKDAQQCAVVTRVAADLDTGTTIIVCPLVRDHDGLALSSRNVYLGAEERRRALAIPRGLSAAVRAFEAGERRAAALAALVRRSMEASACGVDYVAVVDPTRLSPVDAAAPGCEILVAGRIGRTRLLDVIRLGIDEAPLGAAGAQEKTSRA